LTSNRIIKSSTIQRFEEYWPKAPVRRLVDQLYWRAKNRYIALRGASEAGKSTALNLLLGTRMLEASAGQTTGSITEIRPVTGDDIQARVHLTSAAHLELRLEELKSHVSGEEYGDYRRAAMEAREALHARDITLGETITGDDWAKLDFSAVMGQGKMHEVVIDRITLPVKVPSGHPLRWAAEKGVSILDLPGDAQGEVFNKIILAEALRSYPPFASVRVWRADKVDRPEKEPGEMLVVTFLDSAAAGPHGGYVKSIRGTMQDYGRRPFVISAAMDEPDGVSLGLSLTKQAAEERLREWRDWLSQPEQADDAYQQLLRGVEQSLTYPGGGTGALNDALQQKLADSEDETLESDEVTHLARTVVAGLRDLHDALEEPLSPEEELRRRKLAEQEGRQARRMQIQEAARSHVYGKYRGSPWQDLANIIDSGSTETDHRGLAEEIAQRVSEHAGAAERGAYAELNVTAGSPQLADVARPLAKGLGELIASPQYTVEELPTWVDIARVRWELSNLLAGLITEADPQLALSAEAETAGPGLEDEEEERRLDEYVMKEGVLNQCIAWAASFG
jgi:Dynamin family